MPVVVAAVFGDDVCDRAWRVLGAVPDGDRFVGDKLKALERDKIATGLAAGMSLSRIARDLGRSASAVSREVRRNAGPDGVCYGSLAHVKAFRRSRRPKPFAVSSGRRNAVGRWWQKAR